MKKLIGALIVVSAAYLGLTYYGGYAGEQAFKKQLEHSAVQGEMHGYEVKLVSYDRGFMSSHMVMTVHLDLTDLELDEVSLTSHTQIQHGPMLFTSRGLKLGLFAAQSQLELVSDGDELIQWLSQVLGRLFDNSLMIGHFNQTYSGYLSIPELDETMGDGLLTFEGGELLVKGGYDGRDFRGQLELGAMYFNDGVSATLMLSPSVLDFDIEVLDDLVNYQGQVNYRADSLTVSVVGAPEVVLADMGMRMSQNLVSERLDSKVAFTVGEVQGSPIDTRNLIYEMALNQVSPSAVVAWQRLVNNLQQPSGELDFSAHQDEVMEVLELLLQEGLQVIAHVGADVLDGEVGMTLVADYVGLPDGRALSEVIEIMDYFAIADADLEVKVSESVVMQTPLYFLLAQYLDAYFTQEGEHLIMRASLQGGQLNIAGQLFPLEFLLGG